MTKETEPLHHENPPQDGEKVVDLDPHKVSSNDIYNEHNSESEVSDKNGSPQNTEPTDHPTVEQPNTNFPPISMANNSPSTNPLETRITPQPTMLYTAHTTNMQTHTPQGFYPTLEGIVAQQQQQIQLLIQLVSQNQLNNHGPQTVQPTYTLPPLNEMLNKFTGQDDDNPQEFLNSFDSATKAFRLPEGTWKAAIRRQMIGAAKHWFERNEARFVSLGTFKELFLEQYDGLAVRSRLKASFYGNQQHTGQNSEEFVNNKVKMYRRLFPESSETTMISEILPLLHPSVQVFVLEIPHNLDELLHRLAVVDRSGEAVRGCFARSTPQFSEGTQQWAMSGRNAYKSHPHQHFTQHTERNNEHKNTQSSKFPLHTAPNKPSNFRDNRDTQPSTSNNPAPATPKQDNKALLVQGGEIDSSLPSVNIKLQGLLIPTHLDTCSNICLIDREKVPTGKELLKCEENITVANLGSITPEGCVDLEFEIGNQSFNQRFYIVPKLAVPIILGFNWMSFNHTVIDAKTKMMFLGKETREIVPLNSFDPELMGKQTGTAIDWSSITHAFPPEYVEEFHQTLQDFSHLFYDGKLKTTTGVVHKIELTSTEPVFVPQYRLSESKQLFVHEQLRKMLEQDLIEPSSSPYNAPLVVVEYSDVNKEPRLCTDYKQLNKVTKPTYCPSLNISNMVKNIGNSKVFCTLDLKKGYWQVPLDKTSKVYTAFTGPDGRHWQYKVMPFGLSQSPATFMKLMHKVLQNYLGEIVEVFLDDVIIKGDDYKSVLSNLRLVLERFHLFNLTVSLEKCKFGQTEVLYLGHNILEEQNTASTHHISAIQNQSYPRTLKQLQSFLGLCTWLRDYCPDAARVLEPLYQMLSRKPFKWTPNDDHLMDRAKEAFSNLQPLHRPTPDLPYFLQTDGSLQGLGACLYQEDEEGKKRIIANISTTLNETQRKYHSNEIECMAIVWAVKKLQVYLEGKKFKLRTDNRALVWLTENRDTKSKFYRWSLILQEFDFDVEHVKGKDNELPDALSRYPDSEPKFFKDELGEAMSPPVRHRDNFRTSECKTFAIQAIRNLESQIKEHQGRDSESEKLKQLYEEMLLLPDTQLTASQRRFLQVYQVLDQDLYFKSPCQTNWKLFVPGRLRKEVIQYYHDNDIYCHPGVQATHVLVNKHFDWPNCGSDIAKHVKDCDPCARVKVAGRVKSAPLRPRVEKEKLTVWAIDIMGPYTSSRKHGNKYLITLMDPCSKWVEAKAVRKADTNKIIQFLEKDVFSRFGYAQKLISDNGSAFTSNAFEEYCSKHGITHLTTAVYCPRQNPVERKNQNIKTRLRLQLLNKEHECWDEQLEKVLFSIRSTINTATQMSPAEILFNQNLRPPLETIPDDTSQSQIHSFRTKGSKHQIAISNQEGYNQKRYPSTNTLKYYEVNSIVFIRNHQVSDANRGIVASLNPKWIGPYKITHVYASGVYLCQSMNDPNDVRKISHQDIQIRHHDTQENSGQTVQTSPHYLTSHPHYPQNNLLTYTSTHPRHSYDSDLSEDISSQSSFDILSDCTSYSDRSRRSVQALLDNVSPPEQPSCSVGHSFSKGRRKRVSKRNPKYYGPSWQNR
ncbi:hypothetical protein WDU94_005583 [Cyamophila willieti]